MNKCKTESNDLIGTILSLVRNMLSLRTFLVGKLSMITILLWYHFFENGCLSSIHQTPCPGDNNLTGQIPSEVGWLTKMKLLGMSNNMLSDEIPTEIWLVTVLLKLYIYEYLIKMKSWWNMYNDKIISHATFLWLLWKVGAT